MSKIFHAVHKETGERWKPEKDKEQFLMLYDSGYAAVVTYNFYTYIVSLGPEWKIVYSDSFKRKLSGV